MNNQARARGPTSPTALVFTVSVAMLINYVDRGNLATAVPLIHDEFGLSSTQLGFLLSAFYYSYVAFMIPAGWLTERYGPNRVLAGGVFIWGLATLLTGFATGFWTLLAFRLLLGVGESAGFPSASLLFARGLKLTQIDFANGVLGFSYLVGPSIGTVLGGLLMPIYGWRAVFIGFGIGSMLWILPLFKIRSLPPELLPAAEGHVGLDPNDKPPFASILRQPGLWGASLGHFASNYNFYFILAWLPDYLVRERGFSMESMAYVAGIAYLINAVSAFLAGWAVSAWTRSGRSPNVFYKSIMAFGHIASMGTMVGMVVLPIQGSIACLCLFQFAVGISSPGTYAIPQIIAGPLAAGRWVGVQNACGNLAGVFAPAITGLLLDLTGKFSGAFMLAGAINILGLVGWVWMLPRIAPLDWSKVSRPARAPTAA
ncbi:MAG: MFS transporter [Gammaproteobacteria bacterium]